MLAGGQEPKAPGRSLGGRVLAHAQAERWVLQMEAEGSFCWFQGVLAEGLCVSAKHPPRPGSLGVRVLILSLVQFSVLSK